MEVDIAAADKDSLLFVESATESGIEAEPGAVRARDLLLHFLQVSYEPKRWSSSKSRNESVSPLVDNAEEFQGVVEEIQELNDRLHRKDKQSRISEQREAIKMRLEALGLTYGDPIKQIAAIERILKEGYDPGMPSQNWTIGFVTKSEGSRFVDWGQDYRVWRQPIPYEVEEKYHTAKKSKLFDTIMISSPFVEDFTVFARPKTDPIMFGFIPADPTRKMKIETMKGTSGSGKFILQNVVGFRIAVWNLDEDLEAKQTPEF